MPLRCRCARTTASRAALLHHVVLPARAPRDTSSASSLGFKALSSITNGASLFVSGAMRAAVTDLILRCVATHGYEDARECAEATMPFPGNRDAYVWEIVLLRAGGRRVVAFLRSRSNDDAVRPVETHTRQVGAQVAALHAAAAAGDVARRAPPYRRAQARRHPPPNVRYEVCRVAVCASIVSAYERGITSTRRPYRGRRRGASGSCGCARRSTGCARCTRLLSTPLALLAAALYREASASSSSRRRVHRLRRGGRLRPRPLRARSRSRRNEARGGRALDVARRSSPFEEAEEAAALSMRRRAARTTRRIVGAARGPPTSSSHSCRRRRGGDV